MNDLNYSLPFLALTAIYVLLAIAETHRRRSFSRQQAIRFGCISIYLIFIGLRGYIGTDWYAYRPLFDAVPTLFSDGWRGFWDDHLLEPGFVVFASTLKSLWNDYHFFVFANACLDAAILHLFLRRYTGRYALGFLVFLVMGGLTLCDLFRTARSVGLFLLSLRYITERRPLPYFALNGLGLLFHVTAIFYLPLYWFLRKQWPKWLFISVFILGNLFFLCQIEWVRPLIEGVAERLGGRYAYLSAQYILNEAFAERYGFSIGYFERIATALLILCFWNRLHRQRESNVFFVNAFLLYFAAFFFLSEIREVSARVSLLFIFAYWALVPALVDALRIRANRISFLSMVFLYCFLKINGLTAIPLYRYDNLLWGIERYERRAEQFDRYYLNR